VIQLHKILASYKPPPNQLLHQLMLWRVNYNLAHGREKSAQHITMLTP